MDALQPAPGLATLTELVTQTSLLFWWAEHEQNPAVQTYWDALHYIATSLSVGYANFFPVTPLGKAIGAAVMMVGPSLSARALDAPDEVPAKLDAILAELRAQRA